MANKTQRKERKEREILELPERLKRRLIGELVLEFDQTFPVHLARITQIDERLGRILSEVLFLGEDLEKLPKHIREPIIKEITGGNQALAEKLINLSRKGSSLIEEWLDIAMNLAEERLQRIAQALKTFEELEDRL